MQLRSRKIASVPPPVPQQRPRAPQRQPPTRVQKTPKKVAKRPAKGGRKPKAGSKKKPAAGDGEKDAENALQEREERERQAAAAAGAKKAKRVRIIGPKKPSPPSRSSSSSSSNSSSGLSSPPSSSSRGGGRSTIKFYMKPYYKPINPLEPQRPAGVQKIKEWRGQVLLPLGKPYWRKSRKGELELRLPMLADRTEIEEYEARKKGGGMVGRIMDNLDRENDENDREGNREENREDDRENDRENDSGNRSEDPDRDNGGDNAGEEPPDETKHRTRTLTAIGKSADYYPQDLSDTLPDIESRDYDVSDSPFAAAFNAAGDDPDLQEAVFLGSNHGYEDGWVGRSIVGEGAEGRAGLWEKLDRDGAVIDQVVIKQKTGRDKKLRKTAEAVIMEDLQTAPNHGTVNLRAYKRYPGIMAHRLYLEYCQHGNLDDFIAKYRAKKQYFPEEFIWDVFHHLVNACKAMDRGPSPRKRQRPELTTYVHRDIKPVNIFLAAPKGYDVDGTPNYPTAKLGDFGLAIATGDEDELYNPRHLRESGTPGYKAPEQKIPNEAQGRLPEEEQELVHKNVTEDWPILGTPTNVWGIGVCIYKLILLTDAYYDFDVAYRDDTVLPRLQTHRNPEYSKDLLILVYECLKVDPSRRPTFQKLDKVIERQRASFRDSWSTGIPVKEGVILRFTDDELNEMEIGPFVPREDVAPDLH